MEFKITNTQVYGLKRAIKASGNPMRVEIDTSEMTDKDFVRATKLGNAKSGEGHDNFSREFRPDGCRGSLVLWKQAKRYHWFDFISRSRRCTAFKIRHRQQCVSDTNFKSSASLARWSKNICRSAKMTAAKKLCGAKFSPHYLAVFASERQ